MPNLALVWPYWDADTFTAADVNAAAAAVEEHVQRWAEWEAERIKNRRAKACQNNSE